MSRYCVRLGLSIRETEPEDDLDAFTTDLTGQLLALDPEAEIVGSLATGMFQVWVHAEADNVVDAVVRGTATVRAAGHAAEGHTPDWPTADAWPHWIENRSVEAHVVDDEDDDEHVPDDSALTSA